MNAMRGTLVGLVIIALAGCGGQGARELVAVSITPSTADAQNFPLAQVQFAATATYNQPPLTAQLTSQNVMWCIGDRSGHCAGFIQTGATIDGNGLARCNSGFNGTLTVLAGQPVSQPSNPDVGIQLRTFGQAQLTCP